MGDMLAWYGFLVMSSDTTVSLHISPRIYLNILSWTVEIFPNLHLGLMVIVPTSSREGVIVLPICVWYLLWLFDRDKEDEKRKAEKG